MKYLTHLMLAGLMLAPLSAQSVAEKRMYVRLGAAMSQNDLKAFLGDRAFNPIYEIGYDFNGPSETTGFSVYASYLTAHGDPIEKYEGLKQALFGWRYGVDMRFRTPIKGFTPFVGLNVNFYDGVVQVSGRVQSLDRYDTYYTIPTKKDADFYPEGKAKIGMRLGAEYRITESWGVSIDASVSTWISKSFTYNPDWPTGQRYYRGINPVAPSWINFAVQYRFDFDFGD